MLSPFQLWYGRDEPPPQRHRVSAGALSAVVQGTELRYVRLGRRELLRRVYVAVRDHNWGTVPGVCCAWRLERGEDRFELRFSMRHRRGELAFRWDGRIAGGPDEAVDCELDGVAEAGFSYNRLGFNVLHPPEHSVGARYRGDGPHGPVTGRLPELIGPQAIVGERKQPLFPAVRRLRIDLSDGVEADLDFGATAFEMEDQRNWTDGSFKTYSTPHARPDPLLAAPGQRFRQTVRIAFRGAARVTGPRHRGARAVDVTVAGLAAARLPTIGLGSPEHGHALTRRQARLVGALRPAHLRVDVRLGDPAGHAPLDRAASQADALGCPLELAVHLGGDAEQRLAGLARRLEATGCAVARVLVFHDAERSTDGHWVRLARARLAHAAPGAAFAGGTNAYFAELNRARPELDAMDAVVYSITPQVHADDEASMVESLAAQGDTVRSARAFCGDRAVVVSPVTLRPRFNPNATGPEPPPAPGELPAQVDPRQMSLFAAGWTVGSVRHLAAAGAASVTYYETTGWRGLIETDAGSRLPERFPSPPGAVFPVYHVLADVGELRHGEMLAVGSTAPLAVEALALRVAERTCVLLANLSCERRRVRVRGLPDVGGATARRLDANSALRAMLQPYDFRAAYTVEAVVGGAMTIELAPYGTARIEVRHER